MLRTHTCGELRKENKDQEVTLTGWVNSIRSAGKNIMFIDLRDRYGITQVVILKDLIEKLDFLTEIKNEYVLKIVGIVQVKPKANEKLETGEIEILTKNIEILNSCDDLPVEVSGELKANEDTRLKYRYLDLRRKEMTENFIFKHKIVNAIRNSLDRMDFLDVDTPMLARSTPEGARDFLVPSRIYPGKFFALPQSPQVYKQTLMVSGFDRYYQVAKCLRDEDLRGDRQLEFTQIDLEMSFITKEDIQNVLEIFIKETLKEVMNLEIKIPFPHISYKESMEKYGNDKPDLRKIKEDKNEFAFVWVDNFPLFELNENKNRLVSAHHPFTQATKEAWENIGSCKKNEDFLKLFSESFDLVLNGVELGSGGMRIHVPDKQKTIFNILGLSEEEAKEKFGFLLDAFRFGAPPHGGFAIGLDRFIMLLKGKDSLKDFIAFPKTKSTMSIMENSPNTVSDEQLKELHIKLDLDE
ncbi:MAG: aspartate--tRNA ligase [archaeon]|nr:aspartate--tRNA ligase [archaeon]MDD2477520.1 aspartate--tRNA ligase [Candidatus ainarchaeum sp.]MDD3084819.1 aspartate--tRNA ligase [Candidatus ainarchaeum sp.]MDD4221383.1 aspartate--tRNA ligase [Candidatus ainarchaeum sp.]MDD4662377.1 aspartate--tRNA ligase [Candidatus ainarchaeum sp.]